MEGLKRIEILASEIKDEALLEIIKYLLSREDMNEKYLNEEKSLKQMIEFIKGEARKKAQNNVAILKDEEVFSLAIHYWDESNEDLGLVKNPVKSGNTDNGAKNAQLQCEIEEKNYQNTQKVENIVRNQSKKSSKNYVPEGQLSLF